MEVLFRFISVKMRLRSETMSIVADHSARSLFTTFDDPRAAFPMPGIAATGSFSCGGRIVVKPSLTKMTDLRPSRSPPSRAAAPLSAVITTWLRTISTVAAG